MSIVETLNNTVKCKIAPSSIHGVGVFAIMDIKKGEKMFCAEDKKLWYSLPPKKFCQIRFEVAYLIYQRYPKSMMGSQFLSPNSDARLISFMNESKDPNYDCKTDLALEDIKCGQEVLENYDDL